jgi:hypothetical protein
MEKETIYNFFEDGLFFLGKAGDEVADEHLAFDAVDCFGQGRCDLF